MDQRSTPIGFIDLIAAYRQRNGQQQRAINNDARAKQAAYQQSTRDSYYNADARLEQLCARPIVGENGKVRSDVIQQVSLLLHAQDQSAGRSGNRCWYKRPRLYCILRAINAVHLMNKFVEHKLNDFFIPFAEHTLPDFVTSHGPYNFREMFLQTQVLYLSNLKDIEIPEGKHLLLSGSGDIVFEHHQHLGRGGFGEVDKVKSRQSFRMYARKKVLRGRDSVRNRAAQSSLVEELQKLRVLQHEHLVKIVGSYTDDEYIAFIMTPIADYNLGELLNRRRPLTDTESDMLRQSYGCLAGAVGFLHGNKIRHRDLTRRNILVYRGKVYISDFGSAYSFANRTTSNTQHHQQPVSPDYMSPEMSKNEERGSASDMWSLGVVFLEMATRLRGLPLGALEAAIHHYGKSKKRPPYLCYNTPIINTWLSTLRKADGYGINNYDKEPFEWIANLLVENPVRRPSAKILIKDILESPSFTKFCCIRCEGFFRNSGFEYDSVMRQTTEVRNVKEVSEVFDSHRFSTKFDGGRAEDRQNSIAQWAGAVQEDFAESRTSVPYTQENVYSNFYAVPTIHEDIEEDFEDDAGQTPWNQAPIGEELSTIEEDLESEDVPSSQTPRPIQTSPAANHSDVPDKKFQNDNINHVPDAAEEYADEEDDRLFDEISDGDSLNSGSEGSDSEEKAEEDEDALFNEVSSGEDDEGNGNEHMPQQPVRSSIQQLRKDSWKQVTVEDEAEIECEAETNTNEILIEEKDQPAPMQMEDAEDEQTLTNGLCENASTKDGEQCATCNTLKEGQSITESLEKCDSCNDFEPQIVITRATFGAASEKVEPQIVITAPQEDDEPEIVINRASFGAADSDAEPEIPPTRARSRAPRRYSEKFDHASKGSRQDERKAKQSKKVQFEPVNEPIPDLSAGKYATERADQESEKQKAPLSSANLRMHNLSKKRTSALADTLKPGSFIDDTWESASSAPTSVITTSTRERIEKSLLPFKTMGDTFKMLSQQCRLGHSKEVRVLLAHGCNPGTKKKPYSSPIFAAVRGGTDQHFKCARALVGADANVNVVKSNNGKTPLHYAVEHEPYRKYGKLIWLLLNAGARVNVADMSGEYPLMKLFVGNDSNPLEKHRLRGMAILLKAGAKVNISAPATGNTPLHLAVRRQDPWAVAMLLHMGASVTTANNAGATALQITANQFRRELAPNHEQILELLLEADKKQAAEGGSSIIDSKAGVYERTALHLAMYSETIDAADMLLEYGADPDAVDADDKTPRIIARQKGYKIKDGRVVDKDS